MELPAPKVEVVEIDRLVPWSRNPRKDHAVPQIMRSIQSFGYQSPVIVQAGTYRVLAGHGRLKAMRELGVTKLPVVVADIDNDRADLYTLADNKLTEISGWDFERMAELLLEFDAKNLDSTLTGFSDEEIQDLMNWQPETEIVEAAPVPAVQETAISERGDVWSLGRQRLMCGDSTSKEDVSRLFGDAKPFIMVTDPPYGVNYDPSWRHDAGVNNSSRVGLVANDHEADWSKAYRLFPGAVAYVWHGAKHSWDVVRSLGVCGFRVRAQIIWQKPRFAISRGHYHWQHEPCLYALRDQEAPAEESHYDLAYDSCWYTVRDAKTAKWNGSRNQTTIWEIGLKQDATDSIHGTQKPVECMAKPIRNHGGRDEIVYDPFSGSGTTLVACEGLGRTGVAMELLPQYVDVGVRRWQNFTGKRAENLTRPGIVIT